MPKAFRIGLDLDGIIYRWGDTASLLLEWEFGIILGEVETWDHIRDNITEHQWDWLWTEGMDRGLFRHGSVYRGGFEAIRELRQIGDIIVITHRPKSALRDTQDWLSFHRVNAPVVHLLFREESKSSVQPQCHLYIDDKIENCIDLAINTDGVVCLWERPWNETERFLLPQSVKIVNNWKDFLTIAKDVAWTIQK